MAEGIGREKALAALRNLAEKKPAVESPDAKNDVTKLSDTPPQTISTHSPSTPAENTATPTRQTTSESSPAPDSTHLEAQDAVQRAAPAQSRSKSQERKGRFAKLRQDLATAIGNALGNSAPATPHTAEAPPVRSPVDTPRGTTAQSPTIRTRADIIEEAKVPRAEGARSSFENPKVRELLDKLQPHFKRFYTYLENEDISVRERTEVEIDVRIMEGLVSDAEHQSPEEAIRVLSELLDVLSRYVTPADRSN